MAVEKLKYANAAAITITLGSLASDASRLAGRESDKVDNTTNLYLDALVSGKVKVGTSPTSGKRIDVWVYACHDETPTFQDVFDGTDSAETILSSGIRNGVLARLASIIVEGTTDRVYSIRPTSVATLFGGVLPRFWGLFVAHDTGAALNASGHEFKYIGVHHETV